MCSSHERSACERLWNDFRQHVVPLDIFLGGEPYSAKHEHTNILVVQYRTTHKTRIYFSRSWHVVQYRTKHKTRINFSRSWHLTPTLIPRRLGAAASMDSAELVEALSDLEVAGGNQVGGREDLTNIPHCVGVGLRSKVSTTLLTRVVQGRRPGCGCFPRHDYGENQKTCSEIRPRGCTIP